MPDRMSIISALITERTLCRAGPRKNWWAG